VGSTLNNKKTKHSRQMETITREYSIEKKYKILGFNDDQCSCDICGKQELKGTYAIEDLSTGEIIRAGSSCGAKRAGWTSKELVAKYKAGEKENLEAARKEFRSSEEFIAEEKAYLFLDNERNDLERTILNCRDEQQRKILADRERTLQSRLDYLRPFGLAKANKREEVIKKYNIKKDYYLS